MNDERTAIGKPVKEVKIAILLPVLDFLGIH